MQQLDSKSGKAIAEAINRKIEYLVNEATRLAPRDLTKFGRIVAIDGGEYTVNIEKANYPKIKALRNSAIYSVGDIVTCIAPNGNMSNLYIVGIISLDGENDFASKESVETASAYTTTISISQWQRYAPIGTTYYSDSSLTTQVGETTVAILASYTSLTAYSIVIGGTTYYVSANDLTGLFQYSIPQSTHQKGNYPQLSSCWVVVSTTATAEECIELLEYTRNTTNGLLTVYSTVTNIESNLIRVYIRGEILTL